MTSRTTLLTLAGEKLAFNKAMQDALTIGSTVKGTTLTMQVRNAINKVAREYPSATSESIREARAAWRVYLAWREAP
jgi:hypothetical protein